MWRLMATSMLYGAASRAPSHAPASTPFPASCVPHRTRATAARASWSVCAAQVPAPCTTAAVRALRALGATVVAVRAARGTPRGGGPLRTGIGLPALSRSHGAAESVFAPGDYLLPLRGPRRAAARRRDERRRGGATSGGATSGATSGATASADPGARTPWDPMGPLPVASGCGWSGRARLQGALGWRACRPHTASAACARCGSAAAAHASPRGTPTHPAACACADRRARCSRRSRAAGTARRPSSMACAVGGSAAGGRAASVRVRVFSSFTNLFCCVPCTRCGVCTWKIAHICRECVTFKILQWNRTSTIRHSRDRSCYQNNVHRLSPTFCKAAASAHVRHPFEVARASAKTEA